VASPSSATRTHPGSAPTGASSTSSTATGRSALRAAAPAGRGRCRADCQPPSPPAGAADRLTRTSLLHKAAMRPRPVTGRQDAAPQAGGDNLHSGGKAGEVHTGVLDADDHGRGSPLA
jgi:hypothetical protein